MPHCKPSTNLHKISDVIDGTGGDSNNGVSFIILFDILEHLRQLH
jgi:hypothetical protein